MSRFKTTVGALAAALLSLAASGAHAEEKILRIGAPLPLTGGVSPEGLRMKSGYDLWAKTQNEAGGIKAGPDTYKVEIIYSDYQSNTPRAVQSAELMITENKVDAIFAPFGSGATKAVSAITEKYGVPMIAAQASSAQVYDQGFKYLFGMYTPNNTVTEPLINLLAAKNPSIKRIAVLARNDLFPLAIAEELEKYAREKGYEIVAEQKFPVGTVDYSSALTQIRSSRPDLFYVTGYVNDIILIRKQMQELGVRPQLTAMLVGPTTPEFLINTGKLSENIVTASWWDVAAKFKSDDVFGSAERFAEMYSAAYDNRHPEYSVASAAACGVVLAAAVTKAGTVEKSKVRDALASLDAQTFFGRVKFGPTGQIVSLKPPTVQIQNGKPVVIDPPEFAQSEIRFDKK